MFSNEMDYCRALLEGPWTVFSSYLLIQTWSKEFDLDNTATESAVAWVRLPDLPPHMYNKQVLRAVGDVIGKVLKINYNMGGFVRGKFNQLAVSIDLRKPLVSQFDLNEKLQKVEYESLLEVCFECGQFGH
ncbi:hypothetical protein P3X46_009293 [Hevea brasiliensis]|uniref:DUF4283 domain-containing protein n=1 Tax=Hevea brasiliensis TaxID=3981 RepID=A0ABQ9MP16_HEVBR|nr:hypothetical protein P3X46_009293 [Hevea brasiliensis]